MTQHTSPRPLFDKSIGVFIILALVGVAAAMWHHNTQQPPAVQAPAQETAVQPEQMVMKPGPARTLWHPTSATVYAADTADYEIQKPAKPSKPAESKVAPLVKPSDPAPVGGSTDKELLRLREVEIAQLRRQMLDLQRELEKRPPADTRPSRKEALHMPAVKPAEPAANKCYLTILRDSVQYEKSTLGRMNGFTFKIRNDSDKIATWGEVIIQCFNQQGEVFENSEAFFENLQPGQTMVLHSSQFEQFPHEYKINAGKADPQFFEFRIR